MSAPVALDDTLKLAEHEFVVEGVRCAACIAKLERGLAATPGIALARVNFTTRRLRVVHDPAIDEPAVAALATAIGFPAHPAVDLPGDVRSDEQRRLMLALAVSGFAAMNVMLLSVSVWSGAEGATRDLFHWLSALIAIPAISYSGRPFFASAWAAVRQGRTNMDVPISIGIVLTTAMSLYETATGGAHAYFDGAIMLIFFLLAGRFLDGAMRARARDEVAALLRRVPDEAEVLLDDGTRQQRRAGDVAPGMRVIVAAGERIPVDGVVVQGISSIDRALVTGESLPEPAAPGAPLLAGTVNLEAPLILRATASGPDTVIADIARLVEAAGQGRSRYVRVADRAAGLYAPAVHLLAALSLAGWWLAGAGLHQSLMVAVAVLIITCPCALGLAVPIAQVVASGALMRAGVLVKDGAALERLALADHVLLDKTGTVTLGPLAIIGGLPDDPGHRALLAALAGASRHPVARAISVALADSIPDPQIVDLNEQPGCGIEGRSADMVARLGRPDWAGVDAELDDPISVTAFRIGDKTYLIRLIDQPRAGAGAALARLADMGLAPRILSGDRQTAVDMLAVALGVPGTGGADPATKHAEVQALEAAGHRVLMVGDGLNDTPALRAASAAMAPAAASDVGCIAADLVFSAESLMSVPIAVAAARRTMTVVRQNFALAIGYNVIAVPLAIAGQVTPLVAAIAMSGSSLLVVANALRLRGAAR